MSENRTNVVGLLDGATTVGPGNPAVFKGNIITLQCSVDGIGNVGATVNIEVSNDRGRHWLVLATFTLSGVNSASDGTTSASPWALIRANVLTLVGNGATVSCFLGE
jgi:hypothetical protein